MLRKLGVESKLWYVLEMIIIAREKYLNRQIGKTER